MTNDEFQTLVLEKLTNFLKEQNELKIALVRIEHEQKEKFSALQDSKEVQFDVNQRIFDALNEMDGKLERLLYQVVSHEIKLKQVK